LGAVRKVLKSIIANKGCLQKQATFIFYC